MIKLGLSKKNSITPLLKKLNSYSLIAGAVLGISTTAGAKIIYTDINPDQSYKFNLDTFKLNVDNFGSIDFLFLLSTFVVTANYLNSFIAIPTGANSINGSTALVSSSIREVTHAMKAGSTIGSGQNWQNNSPNSWQ